MPKSSNDSSQRLKVLFVDDRKHYIRQIQILCEIEGIEATGATNVTDANELLRNNYFDALVCDLMMPPDDLFTELETMGNRRTGVFFCDHVRTMFPDMHISILTSGGISSFDKDYLFGINVDVKYKSDTSQIDLARALQNLKPRLQDHQLIDALEIKPGLFGIKVDLKKLTTYFRNLVRK